MKKGDLVRFRKEEFPRKRPNDCGIWTWKLGILLEYHTWEKVATILSEGKVVRIHASEVQKAGKRDEEKYKNEQY
tara:strand:+ start:376 stop:600 length:225 start_codon:yes stop_codon:yes gene_type:complete